MKRWSGASASDYGSTCADYNNRTTTSYSANPSTWSANYESISFYIKKISGNGRIGVHHYHHLYTSCTSIDLSNQTVTTNNLNVTSNITALPNNWYRITLASKTNSPTIGSDNQWRWYAKTGEQFYVWGIQFEIGSFPTSYIPTTTAAVTRNADVLTMPTGSWLTQGTGTIFAQIDAMGDFSNKDVIKFGNGGTSRVRAGYLNGSGINFHVYDNSLTSVAQLGYSKSLNTPIKFAGAYANNDFAFSSDGSSPSTDTTGNAPTDVNLVRIGSYSDGGTEYIDGHVAKFKYYPRRIPDTQLQLMTQ